VDGSLIRARAAASPRTGPESSLAASLHHRDDALIELPIEHRDVTTIMGLLGDIQHDVARIRRLLEDEDGQEEEAPEDDA
jgi:hypothetical protein